MECFLISRENFIDMGPNRMSARHCQSPTMMRLVTAGNWWCQMFISIVPGEELPAHSTFSFLHARSSLQQQPAVQEGPHFTEAYLHVPTIDFLQLPKFLNTCVCVYMSVEHLPKHKSPLNVSNYDTICIILTAEV